MSKPDTSRASSRDGGQGVMRTTTITTLTQNEILVIIAEEGGEIVQAATKCLRFGWDRDWPDYGVNHEKLAGEVGDLLGMLDALPLDWSIVEKHRARKLSKAAFAKATIGGGQ